MKVTLISLFAATFVCAPFASDFSHVHNENCNDSVIASHFDVSITELKNSSRELSNLDEMVVIDLMAFYQPSYESNMGAQWVHNRINKLVENTNIGLSN